MTDGPQEGEGNSLWNRLRRRKVVQWGLAYAAGAWALLQVVGFAADGPHLVLPGQDGVWQLDPDLLADLQVVQAAAG